MTRRKARRYNKTTMKKTTKKENKLGTITILAERPVKYVELDVDMDDWTIDNLARAGWEKIQHDKDALVNYAFVKAMEEFCDRHDGRNP